MKINIALELKNKLPEFKVIGYTMTVDNSKTVEVDYLLKEVNEMTDEKIIQIWEDRIERTILCNYHKGKRCGIY